MNAALSSLIGALREAAWLSPARARAYCLILFIATFGLTVLWIALGHDGLDPMGKPLGTDFVSFWTASKIALGGRPAEVYDIAVHQAAQTALFSRDIGYSAFFYPPPFLLICLPLATLPYLFSLGAWLAATGFAYWRVVRFWLGARLGALPIFAFPAALSEIGHGQNAFLSAALLGGGAALLNARPILAGACFGALVYKPHLAIVVPIALVAARRWRALFAAAAAAASLCLASLAIFGVETWQAFLTASPKARMALEQNMVGNEKMQSVFAAVRLLHGGVTLAYCLQAVVAIAVCAALVRLQQRAFRSEAEGPAMVAAALLVSPFLLDYDLTLLAIPLAWTFAQGLARGFLPFEKIILMAAFLLPAFSRTVAIYTGIPLGPPAVAAVLLLVLRRAEALTPQRVARKSPGPGAAVADGGNSASRPALSLAGER
jgi:hypothetical protein